MYVSLKIKDSLDKKIKCMAYKCPVVIEDSVIKKLVDENSKAQYIKGMIESYVADNNRVRWCPSVPHCGRAAKIITNDAQHTISVKCPCGIFYCFKCGKEPHLPATCEMIAEWNRKWITDVRTKQWMEKNTKPCPNCKVKIEKNGGCNVCTK